MKQQRKKLTVLGGGLAVLGLGLWGIQSSSVLKAETQTNSSQAETQTSSSQKEVTKTKEKETRTASAQTQTKGSAISNDQGLSATPKVVQLAKNAALPEAGTSTDELQQLVTDVAIPKAANGLSWEYVNKEGAPVATPSSETIGTQLVYIKITENAESSSIQVPIPITVTDETISIIEDGIAYKSRSLSVIWQSDVTGKDSKELSENLKRGLGLEAWDMNTGETLPVVISDLGGVTESSEVGTYNFTYSITAPDKSVKTIERSYTLLTDSMLENPQSQSMNRFNQDEWLEDEKKDWVEVPKWSKEGVIENPINHSVLGYINRGLTLPKAGMLTGIGVSDVGWALKDELGANFIYDDSKVRTTPYIDGKLVYGKQTTFDSTNGIAYSGTGTINTELYLKKDLERGKILKEIIIDNTNQVAYVYDLSLARNLNFLIKMQMYNLAPKTRQFAAVEYADTLYGPGGGTTADSVPLLTLEGGKGFYMMQPKPNQDKKIAIKVKDGAGRYLSDYTMQAPGIYGDAPEAYKNTPKFLYKANWFKADFSNPGIEQYNYDEGQIITQGNDSAFQLGAPYKAVAQGESLNLGYEVFLGKELEYMLLETTPKELNYYQDTPKQEFTADYILSGVPHAGGTGNIYVDFPNGEKTELAFIADLEQQATGKVTIPRATLPEKLNDEPGTIKTYPTAMIASYEKDDPEWGLPSNEYALNVNIYHLGGTPIAQTVRKGAAWNKTAASLIKDPVIIPKHKADYGYVNPTQPVDTSKLGLQYAEVRMTDTDEPGGKETVIKVPVMVVDEEPPTTGLMLEANDFVGKKSEIANLTDDQLKAYILKKSEAVTWDNATGLSEDIDLSVTETTLTNPEYVGQHTAKIQAKKGSTVVTKTIQINFTIKFTVNFLDGAGKPLHEPYTDMKEVGGTVDLSKITAIKDVLTKFEGMYELKRPDNEIITIDSDENKNIMTYQFNGLLTYVSSPESFDFRLNIASYKKIRVDDPEVIGLPLVVSDTRESKPGWSLKVKLTEELLNEDGKTILKNAIRYKNGKTETILNNQGYQIVSHLGSGKYDVSKEWSADGNGLKLEIAPGAVNALGKYHGEILFELSETP